MADEKSKPDSKQAHGKATSTESASATGTTSGITSTTSTGSEGFQKNLNNALQNYMRSLQEVYKSGAKKSEELYQEFLKAQKEQQVVVEETLKEDYRNLVSSLQKLWGQEDAQSKVEEAIRNFHSTVSDRQLELQKNIEDLQKNFTETVQKQTTQTQHEYSKGYRELLKAFQSAWKDADVSTVDSNTLAAVGHLMIAASTCAGQTIPVK